MLHNWTETFEYIVAEDSQSNIVWEEKNKMIRLLLGSECLDVLTQAISSLPLLKFGVEFWHALFRELDINLVDLV